MHSKSASEESEGSHVCFDASADNMSVHLDTSHHVIFADGDKSVRRIFTSCQRLSQAHISTDVTSDHYESLHHSAVICTNTSIIVSSKFKE